MAAGIVAITFFFITMIILIVTFFKTRHNERMALINTGKTAKIFDSNHTESNTSLKFGLFLLSIGLGLLTGLMIDDAFDSEPAGVFICIFIFSGLSLVLYHFYLERKGNKNNTADNNNDLV